MHRGMSNVIKGWKPASRFLSGIPVRTLRKAVEEGALNGTKTNGIWSFVDSDLLAFAAAIGKSVPKAPTTVVNATTAMPSTSAPAATRSTFAPITADFLRAASSTHVDSEDENQDDVETHEAPFWAVSAAPMYTEGEPVVDPATLMISYRPTGSNGLSNHPPGTLGAFVAQLQHQLADAQMQLAAATTAWRRERVSAIAAEIAVEAITGGAMLQVVPAVRDASHAAAAALPDTELRREDGYPQAVARSAALAEAQRLGAAIASAWQAQQAPWPSPPPREPHDELSRVRARRRVRSPRW